MTEQANPIRAYAAVFVTLLILLVLTIVLASFDLGPFNTVIALVIAAAKAILIALFFMHVKRSDRLIQLFSVFGLLWLLILFMLTFSDYFSRASILPGLPFS